MPDKQRTRVPNLPNAPIKEALIDIQVVLPEKITVIDALDSGYAWIAKRYPKHELLQRRGFGFHGGKGRSTQVSIDDAIDIGHRYTSNDKQKIVQFRVDGFTFSRLEPYDRWEEMKEEAITLWEVYAEFLSPISITRIATRFINQLKLPLNADLKEYLTQLPTIPEGLNQELSRFLSWIEIRKPEIGACGSLTQALEDVHEQHLSVILDIDILSRESSARKKGIFGIASINYGYSRIQLLLKA